MATVNKNFEQFSKAFLEEFSKKMQIPIEMLTHSKGYLEFPRYGIDPKKGFISHSRLEMMKFQAIKIARDSRHFPLKSRLILARIIIFGR